MLKINSCFVNYNTKQNFEANKITNANNFKNTDKQNKKFNYIDISIIGTTTGIGGFSRYKQTNKKLDTLRNEVESFKECWKKEKTEVRKLKDWIESALLPDFIHREKAGLLSDIPNCIMITGGDEKYQKEVIQWIADKSPCRHVVTEYNKNFLAILEKQESTYKIPGADYTLMYIKDMDKLINPKYTEFADIEAMKDIMSSTVEDYHTTIIFNTKNPEELDSIALQPHRVRSAKLDVPRDDFFFVEDCQKRLKAIAIEAKKISMTKNIICGSLVGALVGIGILLFKNMLLKNKK